MVVYEVRNYYFEPSLMHEYRTWAVEHAVPALKGLLPHYGGEVVGFWLNHPDHKPNVAGVHHKDHPRTSNVTWIIRWQDKETSDKTWAILKSGKDATWAKASAKREEIVGRNAMQYYHHIEQKYCEDIPTISRSKL